MLNWKKPAMALVLASAIAAPLAAQDNDPTDTENANQAAESSAREATTQVTDEALAALKQTDVALKALADDDKDAAKAAIENAIGKLEVALAQNPGLRLLPVDVQTTVLDVATTPANINAAKREGLRLLKDGQLQSARGIISALASEIDIDVTYIPLGTYPLALKSAAALVKDDKTDEARQVLENALGTLVVLRDVQPLPILRATAVIEEVEKLSEKSERSDEENQRLATLLKSLDTEISIGEALEYGGPDAFEPLKEQMLDIRAKTGNGGSGKGFFSKLKDMLHSLGRDHTAKIEK